MEQIAAAAKGVACHLVGGSVRDIGLGRVVHDLDVVVADSGPAIARRLADASGARLVALGGERFGALRLVSGGDQIDLWDLQGGPLLPDLWRRDFTVNAIALEVPGGAVVDPTGGEADLVRRRLRATRVEVFAEDPVRVLRLARFATMLPGFESEPATVAAARTSTPRLSVVPHERLRVELEALFSQSHLAPAAGWCDELDLPAFFFGERSGPEGAASTSLSIATKLDAWRASSGHAAPARTLESASTREAQHALHWSLFSEHFSPSHPASASRLGDLARRGLITRSTRDAALALLAADWHPPADEPARRRWLHEAGKGWRDALALRATLAGSEGEVDAWRALETAILAWPEEERAGILSPPILLSGEDIQALLGIAPGPGIGSALARVRRAQVEGTVRVREEAVALVLDRN